MAADWSQSPGFYFDVAGGFVLLALAVLVAVVRPRRRVNWAFAGYAAGVGLAIVGANVSFLFERWEQGNWMFLAGIAVAGCSLVAVGFLLDRAVSKRRRTSWHLLLAAVVPYLLARAIEHAYLGWTLGVAPRQLALWELSALLQGLAFAGLFFVILLAATRSRQAVWSMPHRVAALLSIGLAALPSWDVGTFAALHLALEGPAAVGEVLYLGMFLVCGVVWLVAIARTHWAAVYAGLACFLFPTIGMLLGASDLADDPASFLFNGSYGLFSTLTAAILAYAIVRHQMFDIDIKLKWTLRRGTVALVFLAAFFVVAQLAQNFLSDRYGWAAGGITAGLLLFAIAPIQRAAERITEKALPDVRPSDPKYVLRKKRETYRSAYAAAWADGQLTPKDVRLLSEFKAALGLPDADYAAIEREWAATSAA